MLYVNEIYGPVKQGEGKTAGKSVIFLRLSGCNLACTWCDTPFTWNWLGTNFVHPDKYQKEKEVHALTISQVLEQIQELSQDVKALVISGGEPMLQQRELISLLMELKIRDYWVEVETNGTITPAISFLALIDQINCSPKLENSGPDNPASKRDVPRAMKALAMSEKTTFKFVVANKNDLAEIFVLIRRYRLRDVYLMPEGKSKEEQIARQEEVKRFAEQFGLNFSPRLQVLQWGNKRGV